MRQRKRRRQAGFTLVEVIVSTLITALLAVALIEVALSTKTNSVRLDRKMLADQATKALQSALKAYVTSDPLTPNDMGQTSGLCGPNMYNGGTLVGNKMTNCNVNMWCLGNAVMTDSQTGGGVNGCYALNAGVHTLRCSGLTGDDDRCILPYALVRSPYNGYAQYTVTYPAAGAPPQVNIQVLWTEPP